MLFPATIEFRPNFQAVEGLYHDLKVSEFDCWIDESPKLP